MRFLRFAFAIPCLVLLTLSAVSAHANTINGSAYCQLTDPNTPAPGSPNTGTLCATFQASSINFVSDGNGGRNSLGWFLDMGSTIPGSITYLNGFDAGSSLDMTLFAFTGQAFFTNGAQYSVTHDDGTVMQVNGVTVLNLPQPTSPVTDSFIYTGPTGVYDFAYNYTEDTGGSTYQTNATDSPVPEPSSLALLGTGVIGAVGLVRRRLARA